MLVSVGRLLAVNRKRLRPAYTESELRRIYSEPHDHTKFEDHWPRVEKTLELARKAAADCDAVSVADLSCGNGYVLGELDIINKIYGDVAYEPSYQFFGPIELTAAQVQPVDLWVLGETCEHLDDPDWVLQLIRKKTDHLILSTPIDAFDDDNWEHYWAWSREGVEEMLTEAGFEVVEFEAVDTRPMGPYVFGIWWAK